MKLQTYELKLTFPRLQNESGIESTRTLLHFLHC